MAKPWYEPFKVKYRECKPDNLFVGPIKDQLYTLGYNDTQLIYEYDQYPCNYTTNFTVFWLDSYGRPQEQPYFLTQQWTEPNMTYYTDNLDDVGEYRLRV